MKYVISILFLSFCFQTFFFARTHSGIENQLITQLKVIDNDSAFLYLYVYDSGNKVLETKFYQPDTTTFIRKSLTEWGYNGTKCISQRESVWKDNRWNFTYAIDYGYSADVLQSETHSVYSNGIAKVVKQINFTYFQNQLSSKKEYARQNDLWHLTMQTDFRYLNNKTDSLIIMAYKADTLNSQILSRFQYNTAGLVVSEVQKQLNNRSWMNTDSINWFYFPNSTLLKTQKNKKWNSSVAAWENLQRVDYVYNNNSQVVSESYQHWKTMFWENDIQYNYLYDSNNVLLKKTLYLPIYDDWRGIVSVNYSEFAQNKSNTIKSQLEFWGGNTGELTTSFIPFMFNNEIAIKRGRSIKLSYAILNDTVLSTPFTQSSHQIQAYPNPSNGIYYVNYSELGIKSWSVSDLNGRILKKYESLLQSGVIDITDLPRGIYLLRIITSDAQSFQKLIKQ